MSYLLSIVIPTKNRQYYCLEAVRQILSLNLKNTQIVVQDNSDDLILKDKLDNLNSRDIIYHHHAGVLSFVDNFSEGLSFAEGEYICMIGDDDGVLPNIIPVVEMAIDNDYDAVIPGLNAVYCWPSEHSFIKGGENGYLCLSYLRNRQKEVNCKEGLFQLMEQAGQGYQQTDIPRLYHGIVKKECLDEIKSITGKYFDGLTPDIYISVALCFTCSKVCRIEYPVTISGICPKSGSADSATGRHTGKLKDAPHFAGHDSYTWDPKAPAIYSVESIWAETVLHALNNFSAKEYYDAFRIDILDGICLKKYPQFADEIKQHASTFNIALVSMRFNYAMRKVHQIVKKCLKRVTRRNDDVMKYYNVQTIFIANDIIIEALKRGKYLLDSKET